MVMHFISGLPRSGSTLLSALLRQNPAFHASISSPVGTILNALHKQLSGNNEANVFIDDAARERLLRSCFEAFYDGSRSVVFDTNRVWTSKLPLLVRLFPDCKVIVCLRRPAWIVDSIETLVRKNLELSGIFGFDPGGTVYSRASGLLSSTGMLGFSLEATREAFGGPHTDRLIALEYEALAKEPIETLRAIYDGLGLKWFEHDPNAIEQIPGAEAFDAKVGTPGLHSVRPQAAWQDRKTVLPQDLFDSIPGAFWRANNPSVPVIHVETPLAIAAE